MIANWALIEADFTREYPHVDPHGLTLSWRRFNVLLRGLSVDSWWQRLIRDRVGKRQQVRRITDEAAAERFFGAIK